MDNIIYVLLAGVGLTLYYWLQKRKDPKPKKVIPAPSQEVWDSTVDNFLSLGRDSMIKKWSAALVQSGGNYVPPTLGNGMTDLQIAEELAALKLGQRP